MRAAWRALARPEGDRVELLTLLRSCGALQDAQQRLVEAVEDVPSGATEIGGQAGAAQLLVVVLGPQDVQCHSLLVRLKGIHSVERWNDASIAVVGTSGSHVPDSCAQFCRRER